MVNGQYLPTNSVTTKFLQEKITTTEHKVRGQQRKCSSTLAYRTQANTKYDSFINLNLDILLNLFVINQQLFDHTL